MAANHSAEDAAAISKLADEEFMTGHILTSLAAWGPELEVNLVLASVGQEELGHARVFYGVLHGDDAEAIDYAIYERSAGDFASCGLAEWYADGWAELVAKQFLYDMADAARMPIFGEHALGLDLVARLEIEELFQRDFWTHWCRRIAEAGGVSRQHMQAAMELLWPLAPAMFYVPLGSPELQKALEMAHAAWATQMIELCRSWGLELDAPSLDATSAAGPGHRGRVLNECRSVRDLAEGKW